MSDLFDESIERGTRRGRELAAMDAIVADAQARFLALCREWFGRYRELVDTDQARFELFGLDSGAVSVTVWDDGRVEAYTARGGSSGLVADALPFARVFFGFYENRDVPDELAARVESLFLLAEQAMAGMLEEVARGVARRTTR